jgi:hypothetical protein
LYGASGYALPRRHRTPVHPLDRCIASGRLFYVSGEEMMKAIIYTCIVTALLAVSGCGRSEIAVLKQPSATTVVLKQPSATTVVLDQAGSYRMYTKGRDRSIRDIPYPPQKVIVSIVGANGNLSAVPTRIVTMHFAGGSAEGHCDVLVFDVMEPSTYQIALADTASNLRPVHLERYK